jgi:hypothetical protein
LFIEPVPNSPFVDGKQWGTVPLIRWMNSIRRALEGLDSFVPTLIASDETWTLPEDRQATFAHPIDVQGTMILDGVLIEVD